MAQKKNKLQTSWAHVQGFAREVVAIEAESMAALWTHECALCLQRRAATKTARRRYSWLWRTLARLLDVRRERVEVVVRATQVCGGCHE